MMTTHDKPLMLVFNKFGNSRNNLLPKSVSFLSISTESNGKACAGTQEKTTFMSMPVNNMILQR